MNTIKCAIFDKDGTLLDFSSLWIPVAAKAVDVICKPYDVSAKTKKTILSEIGVKGNKVSLLGALCYGTYHDIANVICGVFDRENIKYDRKDVEASTPRAFVEGSEEGELRPTSPDLKECLERMKKNGIHLFVVTSDNEEMALICLRKLGIAELFDEILADDGVHPSKPAPYYIDYLVEKYGFSKDEMCMVGDTPTDMQFAANGKIKGFGVGVDEEERAVLSKYTDVTSENISTLTKERYFGNI